jgi:aminoacrylate hydrolase
VPTLEAEGIAQYYETLGDPKNPPVMLISGLGGMGGSWGPQIRRFAERYYIVLPDQRGTGKTTRTPVGHTTRQLAKDMAAIIESLGLGPLHVVGASTGGAIAQYMALDYPQAVRSLALSSTFARFDAFTHREFQARKKMAAEWDRPAIFSAYSLFLFSPRYMREHPDRVQAWVDRAAAGVFAPEDREIALKRIDMICAHDTLTRLWEIRQPTLVTCGDRNFCTPLSLSEEIAFAISGATLVIFAGGGELIELEQEEKFFHTVSNFIDSQGSDRRG